MTRSSTDPALRLRSAADVLAAVPYLLGFHPTDSLVVLGLDGNRLRLHVRGDLPPAGAAPTVLDGLAGHYAELFAAHRLTGVVLVGYGPPERVTAMMVAAKHAMRQRRLTIREMLRATAGRYWSYLCQEPSCCPPDGTPYDVAGTAIATAATVAGCVALPDRAAVVREFAGPVGLALAAIEQAAQRADVRFIELTSQPDGIEQILTCGRQAISEAVERYAARGRLTDDELAWLCGLLQLIAIRDIAWRRIDTEGRDGRDVHERLWLDLVRRCPPEWAAPPCMLLSYVLWRGGNGLRARIAADRALEADPTYSAALLMSEVLEQAVPPTVLERARRPRHRGRQPRARVARRRKR